MIKKGFPGLFQLIVQSHLITSFNRIELCVDGCSLYVGTRKFSRNALYDDTPNIGAGRTFPFCMTLWLVSLPTPSYRGVACDVNRVCIDEHEKTIFGRKRTTEGRRQDPSHVVHIYNTFITYCSYI